MDLAATPEWRLEPVPHVDPYTDRAFPFLFEPDTTAQRLEDWLPQHRTDAFAALMRHGALLFRSFNLEAERDFELAAQALSDALEPRYGDLVKRASARFVYDATVYPKNRAILFHNEGSHTPRLPSRQFFFCGRDKFTGGETPIVDCRRVYQALRPELRTAFAERGLVYVRNFIPGVDVRWQDFFRTEDRREVEQRCRAEDVMWEWRDDGGLRTRTRARAVIQHPVTGEPSFCNQIMLHHTACLDARTRQALLAVLEPADLPRNVYFGDGSAISDEVVAEILQVTVRTAARFTWRRGDVLMLDNLSTAHARSPFEGDRQILVAVGDVVDSSNLRSVSPASASEGALA
jgi:alpha-ketoglutarate-dependent taurine dioxygenase